MQEFGVSKYAFQGGAEINCENRIPLCKAACCRLPLALSKEDVQEGIVRWDLGHPYLIAQDKDGYCVHIWTARRVAVRSMDIGPFRAQATIAGKTNASGWTLRRGW